MSGNLGGIRSSGRFAALLTFPGMRFTKCHSRRRWVGSHDTHVAAGINPAALAVPGVNLLIAEALLALTPPCAATYPYPYASRRSRAKRPFPPALRPQALDQARPYEQDNL